MYRGTWDGGPPGAENDYASGQASQGFAPAPSEPSTQPMPSTDPWTGVSYPHYPQGNAYDYQYNNYQYNYGSYYSGAEGSYYSSQYAPQQSYSHAQRPRSRSRSRTPKMSNRRYDHKRRTYSRSPSPYAKKERACLSKREKSYERKESKRRSRSRSVKSKHVRYSSGRSSSRSVSSSRSIRKRKRSVSSSRSESNDKRHERNNKNRNLSKTPPLKSMSKKSVDSPHQKDSKNPSLKDRKHKKGKRSPGSTPPKSKHVQERRERIRESSLTPPRSYARAISLSVSPNNSKSSSLSPRRKRTSSSSSESYESPRSHSKRKPKKKCNTSSDTESSGSESKSTLFSRSRSNSRSKHTTKFTSKSRTKQTQNTRSSSTSSEERRGQFTVADRKRYWKLHRDEKRGDERPKTPDLKPPPPGAVETSHMIDDIEYGDPPDVEGPNFAELLPTRDQVLQQAADPSKIKGTPIPIRNDGSFLEMFKKLQEETKKNEDMKPEIKKPVMPFIGKRRGGRVLKTGLVKKAKAIDEQPVDNTPKDAWSLYMQEVKKYRETSCEEEKKTRPLVK